MAPRYHRPPCALMLFLTHPEARPPVILPGRGPTYPARGPCHGLRPTSEPNLGLQASITRPWIHFLPMGDLETQKEYSSFPMAGKRCFGHGRPNRRGEPNAGPARQRPLKTAPLGPKRHCDTQSEAAVKEKPSGAGPGGLTARLP